jgi:hypothetical protein
MKRTSTLINAGLCYTIGVPLIRYADSVVVIRDCYPSYPNRS